MLARPGRRTVFCHAIALFCASILALSRAESVASSVLEPIPVIDVTDLYHPHQDVGDNFDLVTAVFVIPNKW